MISSRFNAISYFSQLDLNLVCWGQLHRVYCTCHQYIRTSYLSFVTPPQDVALVVISRNLIKCNKPTICHPCTLGCTLQPRRVSETLCFQQPTLSTCMYQPLKKNYPLFWKIVRRNYSHYSLIVITD